MAEKPRKPLRETMPTVTAWIDGLRDAFGAEGIDVSIRAGINGQETFWASENGRTVGTKASDEGVEVTPPYKPVSGPEFQPQGQGRRKGAM